MTAASRVSRRGETVALFRRAFCNWRAAARGSRSGLPESRSPGGGGRRTGCSAGEASGNTENPQGKGPPAVCHATAGARERWRGHRLGMQWTVARQSSSTPARHVACGRSDSVPMAIQAVTRPETQVSGGLPPEGPSRDATQRLRRGTEAPQSGDLFVLAAYEAYRGMRKGKQGLSRVTSLALYM